MLVDVLGDALPELNETINGQIGNASTGTIVTATVAASITDNDQSLWLVAALTTADEDG